MKSIVLFSSKGGVGKTTLTFDIAHMMARQGWRVAVLDYDPQCALTTLFLDEEQLMSCWRADDREGGTVAACLEPVLQGTGDIIPPTLIDIVPGLWLLPGHLSLIRLEPELAADWPGLWVGKARSFDVVTALDRLSSLAAERVSADVLMIDMGPSLGMLSRAALLACDHVIVPVLPDWSSLLGLEILGSALRRWRADWQGVRGHGRAGERQTSSSTHDFMPLGYVVQQLPSSVDRPASVHAQWTEQIPRVFREHVLGEDPASSLDDDYCLASLKHFASLAPYAQRARKPMFDLRLADGVSGGQIKAVHECHAQFEHLVETIATRAGIPRP